MKIYLKTHRYPVSMGSSSLNEIERFGWYALGNGKILNEFINKVTNKSDPVIAYFGDSLKSDIIYPKRMYRLVISIRSKFILKHH